MPIESNCAGCGALLRVSDEYAGRQAKCPECGVIYTVPTSAGAQQRGGLGEPGDDWQDPSTVATQYVQPARLVGEPEVAPPAESAPPSDLSADPSFWLQTPEGRSYGPVTKSGLDAWYREGRIAGDCQIQQEGDRTWHPAERFYPQLRPAVSGGNPFRGPATARRPVWHRPHRGGLILALGVLGLVVQCPLFSVAAWVMGNHDLREIDAGRMDPEGLGLTQAGRILGMIVSILFLVIAAVAGVVAVIAIAISVS